MSKKFFKFTTDEWNSVLDHNYPFGSILKFEVKSWLIENGYSFGYGGDCEYVSGYYGLFFNSDEVYIAFKLRWL